MTQTNFNSENSNNLPDPKRSAKITRRHSKFTIVSKDFANSSKNTKLSSENSSEDLSFDHLDDFSNSSRNK